MKWLEEAINADAAANKRQYNVQFILVEKKELVHNYEVIDGYGN